MFFTVFKFWNVSLNFIYNSGCFFSLKVEKWKLVLPLIFSTGFMLHIALASHQLAAARYVPALSVSLF